MEITPTVTVTELSDPYIMIEEQVDTMEDIDDPKKKKTNLKSAISKSKKQKTPKKNLLRFSPIATRSKTGSTPISSKTSKYTQ